MKKNYEIIRDEEYLKTWLELDSFSKLGRQKKDQNSGIEVEIVFLGTEDSDNVSDSQINAVDYIIDHADKILAELIKFIFDQREELEEVFGLFNNESYSGFPHLKSEKKVGRFMDISTIYIHEKSIEETSYIGLFGDCTWDAEHALGTVFHKDRIVNFGSWDTAFYFYEERVPLSISDIYSLESLADKRKRIQDLAKTVELNEISDYLYLFDWLIGQRAIYGYRSTEVDLTDKEKVAAIMCMEELNLSGRSLTKLPDEVKLLKNLHYLGLRVNSFEAIPGSILSLKKLKALDVSVNAISDLPESLASFKELSYLDISMNKLYALPNCIAELKNLVNLDVSQNRIKRIPGWLGQLKKLKDLRISDNKIKKLPKSIKNIQSLQILYASGNRFSFFQKKRIKSWLNDDIRYDLDNS